VTEKMTISPLEDKVASIMTSVGWTANRIFNASEWISELRSRGFEVLDSGVVTLTEFGALKYLNDCEINGLPRVEVVFDPRGTTVQSIADWKARTKIKLFPIGEVDGQASLLIDNDGAWYLSMGGLWRIGNCASQGLSYLLLGIGESTSVSLPK
jgi:hypothetical protein